MKFKSFLIVFASALLLISCASTPKPVEKITPLVAESNSQTAPVAKQDSTAATVPLNNAANTVVTSQNATPVITNMAVAPPVDTSKAAMNAQGLTAIMFAGAPGVDPASATAVRFAFDSDVIDKPSFALVTDIANLIKANGSQKIVIQGHTDDRGSREYNLALGSRRAVAVKKALQGLGVSEAVLEAVSFGAEKPVDSAQDEAAWEKNRRANFALAK